MSKIATAKATSLLSKQVTDARYFFLNLAPRKDAHLELVMGGLERCQPDYLVARSRFPFLTIEYVHSGQGIAAIGSHQHKLGPGAIFAYGPHMPHKIRSDPNHVLVKYFITLAGTAVPGWLRRCKIDHGKSRILGAPMEISGAFEALLREAQRDSPNRDEICASLLEVVLLKIEDAPASTSQSGDLAYEAFLRCKDYIDAKTEKIQTLRQIARAVGAESYSVCRWFRRYEGISPYQYLLRRRMNLAAKYLVERGGLVKEAAEFMGFADPFHFSHQFKAVHGIAPSELLRCSRGQSASLPRK